MSSVVRAARAIPIEGLAEVSGRAGDQPGYGKIKARTSRSGRSVVMIGFFPAFHTSRTMDAMCTSSFYRVVSTKTTHRGAKP